MWPLDWLFGRDEGAFGGLVLTKDVRYVEEFLKGGDWRRSHWVPRHLEMARLAFLYKQVAVKLGIPLKVADLGCGSGFLTHLLAREGLQVTGIDAEPKYLKKASEYRQLFERSGCKGSLEHQRRNLLPSNVRPRSAAPEDIDQAIEKGADATTGVLTDIMRDGARMLQISWPQLEVLCLLTKAIAKVRPDAVCLVLGCSDAAGAYLASHSQTFGQQTGYQFELGWKNFEWQREGWPLAVKEPHSFVEFYTRDGMGLSLPERIDDVEQYPWEPGIPDLEESKRREFYNICKRLLSPDIISFCSFMTHKPACSLKGQDIRLFLCSALPIVAPAFPSLRTQYRFPLGVGHV